MGLPTNIYDDNFINSHQFHIDDVSYVQKDHLKSLGDSLTLSSGNEWAQPSLLTVVPNIYHQNLISSIPNQNSDHQNHLFPKFPSAQISSKYPCMGNPSYSNTDAFEEFQNNITSDLKFPVTYYTSFPVISEGTSYNMHDFQGNTRLDDVSHNQGFFIGSHEPALGHFMVESQQFNVSEPEDINKSITKETSNRRQEKQVIIKTDQKKRKGISIKGQWTPTEDEMLMKLVKRNGMKKWTAIAKMFQGRIGKQCRERWHNHLHPDIKKNSWSEKEDQILVEVHKLVGNKWTEIAKRLPGRS
ncbi:PREDICTED: myb-like DNA-binding protein BAS1, partial [Camelina sativa]|uniref:Myb-like DNA-binding protein BAS1 n=1 Tax=Camelina sativa TaxID=90675 RepID=A0ABM0Y803_CAMSA